MSAPSQAVWCVYSPEYQSPMTTTDGQVGSLVAVLLLAIGAWYFLRRRRRSKSPTVTDTSGKRFEVEPYEETTIDPRHLSSGSGVSGQSGHSTESRFSAGSTSEPLIPVDPASAYASAAAGTYAYATPAQQSNRYSATPTHRSSLSHITPLLFDTHSQTNVPDVEVSRGGGTRDKSDTGSYRHSLNTSQTQSFYTTNGDVNTDGRLSVHLGGVGTDSSGPSSPTKSSRPVSMDRPLSSPGFTAIQTQPQLQSLIQMHALVPSLGRPPPQVRPRAAVPRRRSASATGGGEEAWMQEMDAGRVFVPPTEHGGTVPPVYDPAWARDHPQLAESQRRGEVQMDVEPSRQDTPPVEGVQRIEDQGPVTREADAGSLGQEEDEEQSHGRHGLQDGDRPPTTPATNVAGP